MIDRFTLDQFTAAITAICIKLTASGSTVDFKHRGIVDGEHTFDINLDWQVAIRVRSSIGRSGIADEAGEDSIRLWVINRATEQQISKMDGLYVTRVAGWQVRLQNQVANLRLLRGLSGDCGICDTPLFVYRSTTDNDNKGRLFCACFKHKVFHWLEDKAHGTLLPKGDWVTFVNNVLPVPPSQVEVIELPLATTPAKPEKADKEADIWGQMEELSSDDDGEDHEDAATLVREPNEEQKAVIFAPVSGAYRTLAAPGSGKSFCVVRRVQYLLANGISLNNMLIVAFNDEMAKELRTKLVELMPELATHPALERNVSTIHAACFRTIKDAGYTGRMPEAETWKIKKCLQDIAIKLWREVDERPTWKELYGWIYAAKSEGFTTDDQFKQFFNHFLVEYADGVFAVYQELENFLRTSNFTTYGDMLWVMDTWLQTKAAFRSKVQAQYSHVIVDEGQDVSGQAMRILTTIAKPEDNFFIVADVDQLLYRFTGATPEANVYDGFEERFPDGTLFKLVINYRSTKSIITACNTLIRYNYADKGGPYEQRYLKDVQPRADAPQGDPVQFAMYENASTEAAGVVAQLQSLIGEGAKPEHFFIGARTKAQLAYVEPYLTKNNIPFVNLAGGSFWSQKHVADVLAMLTIAAKPGDSAAEMERVFNIASTDFKIGWGPDKGSYSHVHMMNKVKFIEETKCNFNVIHKACANQYRFTLPFVLKDGCMDLDGFYYDLQMSLSLRGVSSSLQFILDNAYLSYLMKELGISDTDGGGGPIDDLKMLVAFSDGYDNPIDFLDYAKAMDEKAKADKKEARKVSVILSTVHRLKGMERPIVFGIGWAEGIKTNPEIGLETPAGLLPHTFSLTTPPNLGVLPGNGQGLVEDERCLAYVLASRAKEQLFLSGCAEYVNASFHPSRFVREIGINVDEFAEEGEDEDL